MNLRCTLFGACLLVVGVSAGARAQGPAQAPPTQAAAPPSKSLEHVKFGVALETFYQYNWNRPYDRVNLLRAYDTRANVFGIQQAGDRHRKRPRG